MGLWLRMGLFESKKMSLQLLTGIISVPPQRFGTYCCPIEQARSFVLPVAQGMITTRAFIHEFSLAFD
jgi:hypothetical protein